MNPSTRKAQMGDLVSRWPIPYRSLRVAGRRAFVLGQPSVVTNIANLCVRGVGSFSHWIRRWMEVDRFSEAVDELVFCELERRRVLSVNATFLGGILSIDMQPGLDPSVDTAVLLNGPDDQTFLVDLNGNGVQDGTEFTGQISELQRLVVDGENGYGNFAWYGDFRGASFQDTPLASINIRGLENVTIAAEINTEGFLTVRNIDGVVTIGGDAAYAGQAYNGRIEVGESINIVSNTGIQQNPNAFLSVGGDARFESIGDVVLASNVGDVLRVAGHTEVIAGNLTGQRLINIGAAGAESSSGPIVDLHEISMFGSDVEIYESTGLLLGQLDVTNLSIRAGGNIGDLAVANINVTQHTDLAAEGISITSGTFNTGTLVFQSNLDTTIFEDSDMNLLGASSALNFELSSSGVLSDSLADSVVAVQRASLMGASIDFDSSDFRSDQLNFVSPGQVAISQQSDTMLFGDNQAASLILSSDLGIADDNIVSLEVDGAALLTAEDISLVNGTINFGQLNFNSPGNVFITEASNTDLFGNNAANLLSLNSTGSLGELDATRLIVATDASVTSVDGISLADSTLDVLTVNGSASFFTQADILIGTRIDDPNAVPSGANFGEVALYGRNVHIHEGSATLLAASVVDPTNSVIAQNLAIRSTDRIEQSAAIDVQGDSLFHLNETGSVLLARSTTNSELMGNQFGGTIEVTSETGVLTDVTLRDTSVGDARLLGATAGNLITNDSMENLEVLLTERSLAFLGPALNVAGNLHVVVGLDGDPDFSVISSGDQTITDSDGVRLAVGGNATFRSSGNLSLADGPGNTLSVAGEVQVFAGVPTADGIEGSNVQIGNEFNSDVQLGNLSVVAGNVDVNETGPTSLRRIEANEFSIRSGGSISDVAGASIVVRGDASFESSGNIVLADLGRSGDEFLVGGTASFLAIEGRNADGTMVLGELQIGSGTSSSSIDAHVELGGIDAVGRNVRLVEGDSVFLVRAISATTVDATFNVLSGGGWLEIVSGGSVRNAVLDGSQPAGILVAESASVDAAEWLMLESSEFQNFSYSVGTNLIGTPVESAWLRTLRNAAAVDSSLDVFNNIDSAFTRNDPAAQSLNPGDPASLSEIRDRFDFEATHNGSYAAQVRNLGSLNLVGGVARGDDLNIYIETLESPGLDEADLTISGPLVFTEGGSSGNADPGLVLVAGAELSFEGGSIVSSSFSVYSPELNAFAFQGGEGLGGNFSTARVLPPEASQLDPSTQHFQQQVAAVFGNRDGNDVDQGFQHVVGYADGNYQFFDVVDSTMSQRADLLIRETPFDINFLTAWGAEQLPTSVVFRRAEGLFLYESAGASDLSSASFTPTASNDFVNDVFVGTADPPLPPIVQPAPPPELPLVAPILVLPEAPRTTIEISSVVEARPSTENVIEILIASIDWLDLDVAPENGRLESEEFEQLEVEANERDATDFLGQRKRDVVELAGDLKLPANATDDQIEALIEDIQQNPLKYVDEDGRPIFVDPVYGIIQSDPQRGESLWRLFRLRPDEAEVEAREPDVRFDNSGIMEPQVDVVVPVGAKVDTEPKPVESSGNDDMSAVDVPLGSVLPVVPETVEGGMALTAALWIAIERDNVRFDRVSRARRRNQSPNSPSNFQ